MNILVRSFDSESKKIVLESDVGEFYAIQEGDETGVYYTRSRCYNLYSDGYINVDSIGLSGGFNLFDYPRNSIEWIDPFGLNRAPELPPRVIVDEGDPPLSAK